MAGDAMFAHLVQEGDRHLTLGAQMLTQADERKPRAPLGLRVEPAANLLETLQLGIAGQVRTRASALPVARMELVDELGMHSINTYLGRGYTEQTALFLEFHSSTAAAIEEEIRLVEELVREAGATDITIARTAQERTEQWEARHHLYWAIVNAHPGHSFTITDTAVPLDHLPELIAYAQQLLAEMGIQGSIIGHVGDGNFHTIIAAKAEDYDRVQAFSERLVRQALAWDGTASGEHGIGLVKRKFMAEEHGASLEWTHHIKDLFDPDHLLNPGKVI